MNLNSDRADASRRLKASLPLLLCFAMTPQQLSGLYDDLLKSFNSQPSDLKKCGVLLAQLKVLAD